MPQSLLEQAKEEEMRGDGRVYERKGSPFYWCEYWLRGQQYRQSTGETDEQKAHKFLRRKLMEVGADKIGAKPFTPPQQERVTVNEILDDLVEHYKGGGEKGIRRDVPPQMTSHLKPLREFFGTLRAMQVGSKDVEAFKSQLKAEKKANATINRSLQLLSQAYNYALESDPPKLNRAPRIKRYSFNTNVLIENNIISAVGDNAALLCNPIYMDGPPIVEFNDAFNPTLSYGDSCSGFGGINGNISVDPQFVNITKHMYELTAASPAIDAGSNSAPDLPKKDLAGKPRIVDGDGDGDDIIDMGRMNSSRNDQR